MLSAALGRAGWQRLAARSGTCTAAVKPPLGTWPPCARASADSTARTSAWVTGLPSSLRKGGSSSWSAEGVGAEGGRSWHAREAVLCARRLQPQAVAGSGGSGERRRRACRQHLLLLLLLLLARVLLN